MQPHVQENAGGDRPLSFVQRLWRALTGQGSATAAIPASVVHDPAAQRPHDLDDPFFDGKVQARMGDVIGQAGQKK
jgi:hypothetical protein